MMMTDLDVSELQPGAETDKLVADAIGIPYLMVKKLDGSTACSHVESGDGTFDDFAPSTELNDAFWAARQMISSSFTLDWHETYRLDGKAGWCVEINGHCFSDFTDTPAMAICLAILNLKDN